MAARRQADQEMVPPERACCCLGSVARPVGQCELKCKDTYFQFAALDTAGQWQCCDHLSQGYTNRTRIGSRVHLVHVQLRAEVIYADAHTTTATHRLMLFFDRQSNNAVPTMANMFLSIASAYTPFVQPINYDYLHRFHVLDDKSFSTSSDYGGASVGNDARHLYQFSSKLDDEVCYTGNAGSYVDILSNALWVFGVGNTAVGSVNCADMNIWVRVIYTDC